MKLERRHKLFYRHHRTDLLLLIGTRLIKAKRNDDFSGNNHRLKKVFQSNNRSPSHSPSVFSSLSIPPVSLFPSSSCLFFFSSLLLPPSLPLFLLFLFSFPLPSFPPSLPQPFSPSTIMAHKKTQSCSPETFF